MEPEGTPPVPWIAPSVWRALGRLRRAPREAVKEFLGETVWAWDLARMPRHRRWGALLLRLVYLVGRGFVSRRAQLQAMALTYTTMLAIVPTFAIMVAVFSLRGLEEVRGRLETFMLDALAANPDQEHRLSAWLNEIVANIQGSRGVAGVAFFAFLFLTIIALLSTLEKTLNDVWGITRQRSFIQKFVTYWCIATLGPILLGTALVQGSSLWHSVYAVGSTWVHKAPEPAPPPAASPLPDDLEAFMLPGVTGALLEKSSGKKDVDLDYILTGTQAASGGVAGFSFPAFGLTVLTFAFIYAFLPNTRVRFGPALVGALLTTSLWVAAKWALTLSSSTLVKYDTLYGALATVPITMFWLYTSWLIVILGGEVTFALQNLKSQRREELATETTGLCRELVALRLVAHIAHAYEHGKTPPSKDTLAEVTGAPHSLCTRVLDHLVEDHILRDVEVNGEPGFVPARPVDRIALSDVVDSLRERQGISFDLAWGEDLPVISRHLGQANAAAKALSERVTLRTIVDDLDAAGVPTPDGASTIDTEAAAVSVIAARALAAHAAAASPPGDLAPLRTGEPARTNGSPPAPAPAAPPTASGSGGSPTSSASRAEKPITTRLKVSPQVIATGRIFRRPDVQEELERLAAEATPPQAPAQPAP